MSIAEQKKALRQIAKETRNAIEKPEAMQRAARHFLSAFSCSDKDRVALYCATGSELGTNALKHELLGRGIEVSLPVVPGKEMPLIFRKIERETQLVKAAFSIFSPPESCVEVIPTIVVVPLLAFDRAGYRLGYGGGFYDRTLAQLREKSEILAIGFAFSEQEVEAVPIDQYDQKLNGIVTDKEARIIQ
ncbi:MAG: 5-formyltetrahydrofolate cyclo-ligase [Sneathiellales bacterium]|nr:5-formyltetrahydrofolate cyclo-ligase [Sneathiellales bacterium]